MRKLAQGHKAKICHSRIETQAVWLQSPCSYLWFCIAPATDACSQASHLGCWINISGCQMCSGILDPDYMVQSILSSFKTPTVTSHASLPITVSSTLDCPAHWQGCSHRTALHIFKCGCLILFWLTRCLVRTQRRAGPTAEAQTCWITAEHWGYIPVSSSCAVNTWNFKTFTSRFLQADSSYVPATAECVGREIKWCLPHRSRNWGLPKIISAEVGI